MNPSPSFPESGNDRGPALDHARSILEPPARHHDGVRLREIAGRLELPANSVFRISGTLEDRGNLQVAAAVAVISQQFSDQLP